jgi:hypothetical protein
VPKAAVSPLRLVPAHAWSRRGAVATSPLETGGSEPAAFETDRSGLSRVSGEPAVEVVARGSVAGLRRLATPTR